MSMVSSVSDDGIPLRVTLTCLEVGTNAVTFSCHLLPVVSPNLRSAATLYCTAALYPLLCLPVSRTRTLSSVCVKCEPSFWSNQI